ncbi:MAG: DUF2878 domain-containing protein [Nevskia sp.]|nr:DUF2878 domain-containing protein [Nevskia sp.]
MKVWINALAFQLIWFAIALGAAHGRVWIGALLLAAWLPVHFRWSACRRDDLVLALLLAAGGPLVDTALMHAGLIAYQGAPLPGGLAPAWLAALWLNFALTLNHSLRWIGSHPALAALFGAAGGPLSYWAGQRLGAVHLATPVWQPLLALGAIWTLTMLALARMQRAREALRAAQSAL